MLDTVEALLVIAEKGVGDEFGIASDDFFTARISGALRLRSWLQPPAKPVGHPSTVVIDKTVTFSAGKPTHSLKDYIAEKKNN